uniref:Prion protein b n=1 Tax=Astyanax mexicanus TaxID=7994 RepID=A0A8B9LEX9_ASTMX
CGQRLQKMLMLIMKLYYTLSKYNCSNPGGYPNQNPAGGSYPAGGQYPGHGGSNPGGYPNQNPAGGSYPAGGQYPGHGGSNPGGYPNQYPAGGSYPAGGQYPGRGGSNPGGYPNQNPAGGSYPAGGQYPGQGGSSPGSYPNQYPAAGGYPNQSPGRGGVNPGGYPNQYPAGGGYPAGGQYPARGGINPGGYPNQYPAGGGYPYPAGGGYPAGGQYPARGGVNPGGSYPNWNPNNKILSPRYGGGFGGTGHGIGGSPFSRSVHNMGYGPSPKSKGFAKKAMVAAGVGAVAGMAVGYGLGRFPKPHFSVSSPQEERYYNHYMYKRYGTKSTDKNDYSRDYVYKPPPEAQSYEKYMDTCMNRTDLLQDQDKKTRNFERKIPQSPESDDDTVSITEIGYPALILQMKARKCVQLYMTYSEGFLQKQTAPKESSASSPRLLLSTIIMAISSALLLQ